MKRFAIYLFYDHLGIVDDYITYKLACLREFADSILVISNSPLDQVERSKLESVADTVVERENIGFDVWGYKEAIEHVGLDALAQYDELLLINYTFFGPIYPFKEMFDRMEHIPLDFWGISAHKEIRPNPYDGSDVLPEHIQSHFIAVRKSLLASRDFIDYWREMPMIKSYADSILRHEARFTSHFANKGYIYSVYLDPQDYSSDYALFTSLEETIENRSPILKKRPFFHDPLYLERNAISLRRALDLVRDSSNYDTALIWKSVLRAAQPRTLYANMDLLEVLDDCTSPTLGEHKIAVVAHMFYAEMMQEVMEYLKAVPLPFDLYITTDTETKADAIRSVPLLPLIKACEVRVLDGNNGRDMAPLFIGCRDVIAPGRYDLVCRLHSKKSPQDPPNVARNFKQHMYGNLLSSKPYVAQIVALFERESTLGLVMPPVIHAGYPTLGHAWSVNRPLSERWAKKLGINIPFDDHTPLAPYGGMYWFRPAALAPLSLYPWTIEDFKAPIDKVDGTLAHVLERIIGYACAQAGYHARCVLTTDAAAIGYSKLEYKLQRIAALMPSGHAQDQVDWLNLVHAHLGGNNEGQVRHHIESLIRIAKFAFVRKFPAGALFLKKPYGRLRQIYRNWHGDGVVGK